MKKLALMLSVATIALLSACSSTKDVYTQRVVQDQERQEKLADHAIDKAPEWMIKLPKSTNAVYENGTAVSSDFGMADMKARTMAYAKICVAAGGQVRSQMKMYRNDNDDASTENTELTVRSICPDVNITGVETVELKHISEGGRIRTYILVALPLGASNTLKKDADSKLAKESAKKRAPEAFNELDTVVTGKPTTKTETLQLLDVDNAAYKAKREETLQKPNAVIGQATLR